ncbi:MAG: hypothetical protein GY762_21795, partial [Proteobacteria bacterium]|nr:hypothetical protein [Pseudomonadota bacterium]
KRQTLFDILADGSVTIGGEDSGVDMSGGHFGFYLKLKGQPPIHSKSLLNAEGKDHMRAYQGNGERIDMSSILGSDMSPITWGTDQYMLTWDIGIGDDEYADVLILVDAIETPAEETDEDNCFINSIWF